MSGIQSNAFSRTRPEKVVSTQEATTISVLDDQVQVFSDTDPPDPSSIVELTLPCNPRIGEQHLIVGGTATARVDSGDEDVPIINGSNGSSGQTSDVGIGECANFVFVKDPCNGNGHWVRC
jgi:hypothetical protein